MLARTFASALIPCGIAAFFSCFPVISACSDAQRGSPPG